MVEAMRSTAYIKLIVIIAVVGVIAWLVIRYILGLPSPQEKVLINAMTEFKRGRYDNLSAMCVDKSFYKVVDKSVVYDTNGSEIDWHAYDYTLSEASMREAVEIYVRANLQKFVFKSLDTQVMEDKVSAVVKFSADVVVADYTGGNLLAPVRRDGTLEGKCHLKLGTDGEWLIEKFEISLFSVEGMSLSEYMRM